MTRPTNNSPEIHAAVAAKLAPSVAEWSAVAQETVLADLVSVLGDCFDWDGYALARQLERNGYTPDADLVGILELAELYRVDVHRKAVAAWVKEQGITLACEKGTWVAIRHEGNLFEGEIVTVDHEQARYTVRCPSLGHVVKGSGPGTLGLYANAEDVVAVRVQS